MFDDMLKVFTFVMLMVGMISCSLLYEMYVKRVTPARVKRVKFRR